MNVDGDSQAKVLTLQRQVELLADEHAKAELLCRARLRQISQLETELQRVTQEAALQTGAAAEAEERALKDEEEARSKAKELEHKCTILLKRAEKAEKESHHLKTEVKRLTKELADARIQTEWQAQRILELEDTSSTARMLREHDSQLKQMQEDHAAERRQLVAQLNTAHDAVQALQRQAIAHKQQQNKIVDVFDNIPEPTKLTRSTNTSTQGKPYDPLLKKEQDLAKFYKAKAIATQLAAAALAIKIQSRQQGIDEAIQKRSSSSSPIVPSVLPTTTHNQQPAATPCSICDAESTSRSSSTASSTTCSCCESSPAVVQTPVLSNNTTTDNIPEMLA